METVYIETTVVGNIAGRIHPNPAIAARHAVTRRWLSNAPSKYRLLMSELVVAECSDGDPTAAEERLAVIADIVILDTSDPAEDVARSLLENGAVPQS